MDFFKKAFSDGEQPSSGRLIMGIFAIAAVVWISYIVYKTGAIPELGGLTFFVGAPFIISKGTGAASDYFNKR